MSEKTMVCSGCSKPANEIASCPHCKWFAVFCSDCAMKPTVSGKPMVKHVVDLHVVFHEG